MTALDTGDLYCDSHNGSICSEYLYWLLDSSPVLDLSAVQHVILNSSSGCLTLAFDHYEFTIKEILCQDDKYFLCERTCGNVTKDLKFSYKVTRL